MAERDVEVAPLWLTVFRWVTALPFIGVGISHFTHLDVFLAMMPPYLPWHAELVWLSGVAEILGGVGLLLPRTRTMAGWGLLALLVAVYPANIHMALHEVVLPVEGAPTDPMLNWVRLPLQFVMAAQVWAAALWQPGTGANDAAA